MSSKRARTAGGGSGTGPSSYVRDPRRIAIAIAARTRSKFPYGSYGTAHYRRGSPDSLNMFGPTFRAATAAQQALRKSTGFVGRGRYGPANFVKDMRTLGLNKYTNQLGDIAVGAARDVARYGVAKLTGRGAYAMSGTNDLFSADDKDDIIIGHSEFIQSITPTSESFQTQFSSKLNPGLQSFAPMLAQVAQYYEEYEFLQLVFEFRSTVVDGNDNAKGTLLMATQYNPTNPLFSDEVSMDNYAHSCATKVTDSLLHGIECQERSTGQARFEYVRSGEVPAGQDPKTYDLALFQLATQGCAANLQLGRLYVHYKVRLSKLKLVPIVQPLQLFASRRTQGSTITSTYPLGQDTDEKFYKTNVSTNIFINDNFINFGADIVSGRFMVCVIWSLNAATAVDKAPMLAGTLANCAYAQDDETPFTTWYNIAPASGVSAAQHVVVFVIDITAANAVATFSGMTLPAGSANTKCSVVITQISNETEFPNSM